MKKKLKKTKTLSLIEKQQAIEAIRAVIKARLFFVVLAGLQVMITKISTKGLSLTSGPMAILLISIVFLYCLACWFYLRRPAEKMGRSLQIIKASQVVFDELMVTIMIYFNGTVNTFTAVFFLIIIMSGTILYREKGIIIAASLASFIYTSLALLEFNGLFYIHPHPGALKYFTLFADYDRTIYQILNFNVYTLATAIYAGFLAGLNKKREKSLEEQKDELVGKTKVLIQQKQKLTNAKNQLNRGLIREKRLRQEADQARYLEELKKQEVEAVIQNLTAGLIMLNLAKEIVLINSQAEKMLGISRNRVIGKKLVESQSKDLINLAKLLNPTAQPKSVKKILTLTSLPERIVEINTASVVDLNNNILGQIIVLNDITREREIDKMKSEFITITAHQLRTPLTELKWAISLLLASDFGPINKKQKLILQKGFESNEKMIILINDLLNLTRIESGKYTYNFSSVSLVDLVSNSVIDFGSYCQMKKIKINYQKPKEKFETMIDKEKIALAIKNLIENALNYSPAGSTVTISLAKKETNFLLAIKDNGIGISEKEKPRIFSKFFRGSKALIMQPDGKGIGLYIAKNIIEGHQGKIWFESTEGSGATFYFSLPIKKT